MNELMATSAGTPPESLHAELRALIAASRQRLAGAVNAELTRLYWTVGQRLAAEVLGGVSAPPMAPACLSSWASNCRKSSAAASSGATCAAW